MLFQHFKLFNEFELRLLFIDSDHTNRIFCFRKVLFQLYNIAIDLLYFFNKALSSSERSVSTPSSTSSPVASTPSFPPTNCFADEWSRWSTIPLVIKTFSALKSIEYMSCQRFTLFEFRCILSYKKCMFDK